MNTPAKPLQPPLDELMMAMDVVDTLRHDEAIAIKVMGAEDRDQAMIRRLREIYESQGIEVPERILREGVEGLKQNRFVYDPPAAGMSRWLALAYVRRHLWGKWLAFAAGVFVVAMFSWRFLVTMPAEQEAEALRIELTEILPANLKAEAGNIAAIAVDEKARAQSQRLLEEGLRAASEQDVTTARKALQDLNALERDLASEFEVRIVSRPGTPTGITRMPQINDQATNYYLVVEAVAPDGKVLPRKIVSEEDGSENTVSIWAQRVPLSTFDRTRLDKEDDGIVQDNVLGIKARGRLSPEWLMPAEPGAIVNW